MFGKNRLKIGCLFLICILMISFASCKDSEHQFGKDKHPHFPYKQKVAMHVTDDGWVYTFSYTYKNIGKYDECPYLWQVKNIRYSTTEEYPDGPAFISWGRNSTVQGRGEDMETISNLLGYNAKEHMTVEELLALGKDDIELQTIDEDLFFSLIRQALNQKDPCKAGPYGSVASSGMLVENKSLGTNAVEYDYVDGYTFQVGYVAHLGTIAAIHIDVLFEDSAKPFGFSQLSDMIDAGEATEEQIELYAELKRIEQGVLDNCDFLFENTEYDDKVIAGVDLARLAVCLERLEHAEY